MKKIVTLIKAGVVVFGGSWYTGCSHAESTVDASSVENSTTIKDTAISCHSHLPSRYGGSPSQPGIAARTASLNGMVRIPAGTFLMGADDAQGDADELPKHAVSVDAFWMDVHEVTNAQFAAFVEATSYLTTAEQKPVWEELKKQLPPGTPKPAAELLVASSLVFTPPAAVTDLNNYGQWWKWEPGANWRQPEGLGSSIAGKENLPVVHVSWDDALAYATWAGKRLPTEAEWEWAARGGLLNKPYTWGDEDITTGNPRANTWQGHFPVFNAGTDGFTGLAPVKSFPANGYGLFDMAGNVWEWCADWYRGDYYQKIAAATPVINPQGPQSSFDPQEPYTPKKTVRGGSFMCHKSYCTGYRVSRRMKSSTDTGSSNTGFRCVVGETDSIAKNKRPESHK